MLLQRSAGHEDWKNPPTFFGRSRRLLMPVIFNSIHRCMLQLFFVQISSISVPEDTLIARPEHYVMYITFRL